MAIVVGFEATVCQVPNLTESSQEIRIHGKKKKNIIILGKWDIRQKFRKAFFYTTKHSGVTAPVTRSFGKQTFRENASKIFPDTTPVYLTCKFTII